MSGRDGLKKYERLLSGIAASGRGPVAAGWEASAGWAALCRDDARRRRLTLSPPDYLFHHGATRGGHTGQREAGIDFWRTIFRKLWKAKLDRQTDAPSVRMDERCAPHTRSLSDSAAAACSRRLSATPTRPAGRMCAAPYPTTLLHHSSVLIIGAAAHKRLHLRCVHLGHRQEGGVAELQGPAFDQPRRRVGVLRWTETVRRPVDPDSLSSICEKK